MIAFAIIEGILMYFIVFPIKMFIICPVVCIYVMECIFHWTKFILPQCRQSYVFI